MVTNYKKKLEKFQNALDLPKWYLGLSDYQERTVTELCDDLRDDFEQGTSFRVEKSLMRLGLSPLISKKKIRTMVQLSRGNDLAFLFFILEGYYMSCRKNGEYSTNEKLLMVAIAKLDLLPTLRELDRLLPPPQESALNQKHRQLYARTQQTTAPSTFANSSRRKKSNSVNFPYFQRQPRPKEISVNYVSKPSDLMATFSFWPIGERPDYGKDSDPPWFAEYNLNPVGRLVKTTVGEAVDKYFNNLNHIKDLQSRARYSRRAAVALQKAMRQEDNEAQMCAYHKFAIGEAQLIKDEITVLARNRCLELMDITLPYRKLRQKRIVNQLERDIDECLKRYHTKMESTTVHTIARDDCVLCQEQRVNLPVAKLHDPKGRALVGDNLHLEHTEATDNYVGKRLTGGGLLMEPVDFLPAEGICEAKNLDMNAPTEKEQPSCFAPKGKSQHRISFLLDDIKLKKLRSQRKESLIEVKFQGKQTKKSFFLAPTYHKPYQFKYKRIFKSGQEKPRNIKRVIAKAVINALDRDDDAPAMNQCTNQSDNTSDDILDRDVTGVRLTDSCPSTSDTSNHSTRSHEDNRADIIDAVVRCAKQIWMKNVNIKRAEMEAKEAEEKSREGEPQQVSAGDEPLDPDNNQLMNRLLQEGLLQLRTNQRYVLASLPDAHKLPVLREWIKRRYGKKYSEEEVEKSIRSSLKVFELITLLQTRPPSANLMGIDRLPRSKENFGHCKEVKALATKVREAYYKKLNDVYMNHMTACWVAMGNYMCRGGPPRKTFYAYMSANTRDIMRNKVWNGEFRNIRQLREMCRKKN